MLHTTVYTCWGKKDEMIDYLLIAGVVINIGGNQCKVL